MKKLFLTLFVALFVNIGFAQNMKVQDAFNFHKNANQYIKDAEVRKNQGKMEKAARIMGDAKKLITLAKDAIDQAAVHEGTSTVAKTFHYRGIIYYEIGHYPEFNDLEPNALDIALESFKKAKELDEEYFRENSADFRNFTSGIGTEYYNIANESLEQKDYVKAMEYFMKAYKATEFTGKIDNQSLLGAAQSAFFAQQYTLAEQYFTTIINNGGTDPQLYYYLAESRNKQENYEGMLQAVDEGLAKNPENELLTNEKINAFIGLGQAQESISLLEEMAIKNSDKPVYYFNLGTIYGNKELSVYDMNKAIEYYEKAIAIDEKYENAYINAGGLYVEAAATEYKKAEEVWEDKNLSFNDQMKVSDEYAAKAQEFDKAALPYVEKAYQLLPDDPSIKQVLKGIYTRLKMNDKAMELN